MPTLASIFALVDPTRPDDPVSFAAILLLGLALAALAIGRPVARR